MGDPLLVADQVSYAYATGHRTVPALAGITFAVEEHERLALTGASGSGKSTLLGLLGLLDLPSSGRVVVDGRDGASMTPRQRAALRQEQMGFVFQQFHLVPTLDAQANVEMALRLRGASTAARRSRARECLSWVGLDHRASHRPLELSGGEQQRVALARAIAPAPRLVLADEPTGNLDADNRDHLLDLFDRLNRTGTTIVTVTHDPCVAARADRVLQIHPASAAP